MSGAAVRRDRGETWHFTGRHMLYALAGFFGVMLAANAVFVWLALDSFSGAVSQHPYEEGLAYNQRLAAAERQQAQGWQGAIAVEEGAVVLTLSDRQGRALRGFFLEAQLLRPTNAGMDRRVAMTETAPGRYRAPLDLPAGGNWNLVIAGEAPDGSAFETRSRIWVD